MAVRIRMKQLGRLHRPYYRICVMDSRTPRNGKAIEEVGTYDPMIRDTDKRVTLKAERIDYWMSVGALPSEKVARLIEKYKGVVPEKRTDQRPDRKVDVATLPTSVKAVRRKKEVEAPAAEAPAAEAPAEPATEAEATPAETPAAE